MFLTVNQVLQRALAQESRSKDAKFKPDRLGMHVLQGESSDDEGSEVYAAGFVWSSNDKPSICVLTLLSAPICIPQAHGSCSFSLRVFPQGLSIHGTSVLLCLTKH